MAEDGESSGSVPTDGTDKGDGPKATLSEKDTENIIEGLLKRLTRASEASGPSTDPPKTGKYSLVYTESISDRT